MGPEGVPYIGDPDTEELLLTADELKGFSRVPPELLEGLFGVKTLVELMQRIRLPVFHEHFEGSLHFETLFSMFHDKLELPKSFWMGIQEIMTKEDGEMDIAKFIKRLSTRLMRDTIMAWTMQYGSADGALELMFDRYLAQKDMEGAGYTEVLLSFFAWCREGDLRNPPKYPDLLPEERELYERWEAYKRNRACATFRL